MADSTNSTRAICVDLLKCAKSDNEKLAGLLLVPKLFEASSARKEAASDNEEPNQGDRGMDKQLQRDLLDAIDFKFLKRMLSIKDKDENISQDGTITVPLLAEDLALKTAALSVIVCFGEEDVFESSQLKQMVSLIEDILYAISCSPALTVEGINLDADAAADASADRQQGGEDANKLNSLCIQCLENFAKAQENLFIEETLMPSLYRILIKQTKSGVVSKSVTELVGTIVKEKGALSWLTDSSKVAVCAMYLHQIKISPGDIDFSLCECAARVIAQVDVRTVPAKLQPLVDHVMGSLCDALKNKLPSKQRQQTLKLLTALVQVRGIKQLINDRGSKAALLVIHLCSIEVRMTLESDNHQQVVADSETLCSSFFALEQMIFYMAHEETTLRLDSKEILQVHSALHGAVSALLYFLSSCSSQETIDEDLQGVIGACIRLLGAWTAEETQSLMTKYIQALPDLIKLCFGMMKEMDSYKFLIPGLSNLTTDSEAIVEIIVEHLESMCEYVVYCCTQLAEGKEEYEHILVNTCVVLLNCLMMPYIKLQSDPICLLLENVTKQALKIVSVCTNVDCNLTLIVCGLASLRKVYELNNNKLETETEEKYKDFYRESIDYVLGVTEKTRDAGAVSSSDIPEIWLMGVQVLNELMKYSDIIKTMLIEEDNIRKALKLFDKYSANVDVVFVLERLLLTIADKAGTKDLVTKVNKAKMRQSGASKGKAKRK